MAAGFEIRGNDGWQWLITFVAGGNQTGIGTGQYGVNLAAIRALNAAIRAENRADRQQCWANGHFVGVTGKCIEDPEIGVAKALAQLNGDTPFPPGDTRRVRLEGYVANQFYREWENAVESGEGSSIQGVIDKYGQYSDLMSTNPFIGGLSFNMASADQIYERMILGDNEWGAYVKLCSPTVTTNCVDPTAIKDIWEDFGRHVRVIFKGLQIPGLPDWLPLPGIIRIPTLGEIWDKVSGTWNEEVDRQIDECLDEDADGDGTSDNTYDECAERINPAGVIMGGIGNAAEEIYKETSQKIKDIVEKDLEVPCAEDLEACAEKTKQVIGDIFEGVWDSADPTMPGIPDWVKLIIIAGEYGDDFIKILEGQTNSDINGDGVIGLTQEQFDCSTINRNGGVVEKEEDCGACLPNFVEVDGQCTDWTDTGVTAEECAAKNREHIPSTGAGTNSACGGCLPDFELNETGDCVASPIKCEGNQVLNETTGECEDPPPDCTPGDPCKDETGASGTYDDKCDCIADWINSGPSKQDCSALGKTHVPADAATQTPSSCGACEQEGWTDKGANGECVAPPEQCQDPNRNTNDDGSCAETCADGSLAPASGLCPDPTTQVDCTQPRPGYTPSFNPADNAAHFEWQEACGETHCPDGSEKPESGICGEQPQPTCNNGAVNAPDCNDCGDNSTPDMHEGGDCNKPLKPQQPQPTCNNGAVNAPDCNDCGDNSTPDMHEGNDCTKPLLDQGGGGGGSTGLVVNCDEPKIGYTPSFDYAYKAKWDAYSAEYDAACGTGGGGGGGSFNCNSLNRQTREDGSCGECLPGYVLDQNMDNCVKEEVTVTPTGTPTETPETGGGASVGGGAGGAFSPFLAGITYTPQPVPEVIQQPSGMFTGAQPTRNTQLVGDSIIQNLFKEYFV